MELVLGLVKADISWRKDYAKHSEIRFSFFLTNIILQIWLLARSVHTRTLSNTLHVSTFKRKYSQERSDHSERQGDEIYRRTSRISWPPIVESLNDEASGIHELLKLFYVHLLSTSEQHHEVSEREFLNWQTRLTNILYLLSRHTSGGLCLHRAKVANDYSGKVGTLHHVRPS